MPDRAPERTAFLNVGQTIHISRRPCELTQYQEPPDIRAKIQKWLSPSEFSAESSDFKKHLRSYVPKTGEWLRDSEEFIQWHEQGTTLLWVNGTPGSGKSVVAATLISDFVNREDTPVLYFFFRHANLANRTPQQLTRDWLSQLLNHSALVQSLLKDLMNKHSRHEDVAFYDLWECLCLGVSDMSSVYCVADALDEMERGHDWFLHKLINLGQQKPATLKVVTTSRQSPFIEAIFKESIVVNLNLNRCLIDQDIATYVDHLLRNQRQLGITSRDQDSIKFVIQAKATGIFLYAKLMMQEVLRGPEEQPLQNLLSKLPTGVNGMYTSLLKEHSIRSGVPHDLQMLILQWVTHASRPLRLLEVAQIIRTTEKGAAMGSVQEIKDTIRTACGPLLTILPDETLQVIHHSFTEFLVGDTRNDSADAQTFYPIFEPTSIHRQIAITLIDYVISCSTITRRNEKDKEKYPCRRVFSQDARDNLFMKHPLLQYAIFNWTVHASKSAGGNPTMNVAMDEFFTIQHDSFSYWQGVWRISDPDAVKDATLHPQHVLAHFGITWYLSLLCPRHGFQVDLRDSNGRTPLSYASERGHLSTVELLIANDANVHTHNDCGIAPIHYASSTGHTKVVKSLLEAGANPLDDPEIEGYRSSKTRKRQRVRSSNRHRFGVHPLHCVCKRGFTDCLHIIIRHIDPNILRQPGPIHWAAESGQAEVAKLLLETGNVDPNLRSDDNNTPLCLAAHGRSSHTVEVLLRAGADIHGTSDNVDRLEDLSNCVRQPGDTNTVTALHALACEGGPWRSTMQELVNTGRILLNAGCDVNAKDSEGKTPLFWWSQFRDSESTSSFLRLLLENGADGAAMDNLGNNPLHHMSHYLTESHVRCLIKAGSDINARSHIDGQTPIMRQFGMANSCSEDWYTYVEKYGINPNAQDSKGETVLHKYLAAGRWDVPNVQHWLKAGANPNMRDLKGQTCLYRLCTFHNTSDTEKDLVSALVKAGLDLKAVDHEGRNVGLHTISRDNLDEVQRIGSYGVDLKTEDYQGRTALHIVASGDSSRISGLVDFLMGRGVNLDKRDHAGNTVSHLAIGNNQHWQCALDDFVKRGTNLGVQNYEGRTALHVAAALPLKSCYEYDRQDGGEKRVKYLLNLGLGLDVDLPDHRGVTALHLAAIHSACRVSVLVHAGVKLDLADHQKRTALHYAARGGNPNALGFLVSTMGERLQEGTIDHLDENGRSALHDAVRSGVFESVQILLNAKSDPNVRDLSGKTALHVVSEQFEERSFALLQECSEATLTRDYDIPPNSAYKGWSKYTSHPGGLRVTDPTRPGEASTKLYRENKPSRLNFEGTSRVTEIIRLLLDAGCDPDVEDFSGRSAYDSAMASKCTEAAHLLDQIRMKTTSPDKIQRQDAVSFIAEMRRRMWSLKRDYVGQAVQDTMKSFDEVPSILLASIQAGDTPTVEELLKIGVDPTKPLADGKTVLHTVARNGLLSMMRLLLRDRNIHSVPNDLLHEASRHERPNLEMMKVLVEFGSDVNIMRSKRSKYSSHPRPEKTVMHILAEAKHWWYSFALEYLLKSGGNPEITGSDGKTVLQVAVDGNPRAFFNHRFWRAEVIQVLLNFGVKLNVVDEDGQTPLMHACTHGVNMVKWLLSSGANISFGPFPPIGSAVETLDIEIVEAFIDAGADCNASWQSPRIDRPPEPLLLHLACKSTATYSDDKETKDESNGKKEAVIKLLLKNGANPTMALVDGTPLLIAVIRGFGILTPFMTPGANLEVEDHQRMTPFVAACACQYTSAVKKLMEAGANMHAVDSKGMNGLHHICRQSESYYSQSAPVIVQALVRAGMPLEELDGKGFAPLHYAIRQESDSVIKILLAAGANATKPYPEKNKTALHFLLPRCAENGDGDYGKRKNYLDLVTRFVEAGVDREQRDEYGNTPIFGYVAVRPTYDDEYDDDNFHPDLDEQRRLLSDHDIHACNHEGQTLMHVVAKRNKEGTNARGGVDDTRDMFKLLWDLGADPKAEDCEQRSPLDYAAACGNTGVLDLFAPPKEMD